MQAWICCLVYQTRPPPCRSTITCETWGKVRQWLQSIMQDGRQRGSVAENVFLLLSPPSPPHPVVVLEHDRHEDLGGEGGVDGPIIAQNLWAQGGMRRASDRGVLSGLWIPITRL